jgi:hypothetical protein
MGDCRFCNAAYKRGKEGNRVMSKTPITIGQIVQLTHQLSPSEKLQLIERLATDLKTTIQTPTPPHRRSLRGILKDADLSAEEIDLARQELWGNFPREDI